MTSQSKTQCSLNLIDRDFILFTPQVKTVTDLKRWRHFCPTENLFFLAGSFFNSMHFCLENLNYLIARLVLFDRYLHLRKVNQPKKIIRNVLKICSIDRRPGSMSLSQHCELTASTWTLALFCFGQSRMVTVTSHIPATFQPFPGGNLRVL